MNRIKHSLLSLIFILSSLIPGITLTSSAFAASSSMDAICEGVSVGSGGEECGGDTAGNALSGLIKVAIRILQTIVGIISLFVMTIAGLGYITSGGDSGKTKTAKDRILYAAIGLVVVALAEIIVQFVLNRVNGAGSPATPEVPTTPELVPAT